MYSHEMDAELREMTGQTKPTYYYIFNAGAVCRVELTSARIIIRKRSQLGSQLIGFYNYFERHAYASDGQKPNGVRALFLGYSESKINDVISGCALCSEFSAAKDEVQYFFNDLALSMQARINGTSTLEQLESNLLFWEDDGNTPKRFTSLIALLENQPVTVYEVTSLTELLTLEYFFTFFGPSPLNIAICEECKKMFVQKRNDARFCSNVCQEKSLKRLHKSSPYWVKYRSLQQRYNKKVNRGYAINSDLGTAVNNVYQEWRSWASKQVSDADERYSKWKLQQEKATLNAALLHVTHPEKPLNEPMPATEFAARLKNKWQELSAPQMEAILNASYNNEGDDYYESCDLRKIFQP